MLGVAACAGLILFYQTKEETRRSARVDDGLVDQHGRPLRVTGDSTYSDDGNQLMNVYQPPRPSELRRQQEYTYDGYDGNNANGLDQKTGEYDVYRLHDLNNPNSNMGGGGGPVITQGRPVDGRQMTASKTKSAVRGAVVEKKYDVDYNLNSNFGEVRPDDYRTNTYNQQRPPHAHPLSPGNQSSIVVAQRANGMESVATQQLFESQQLHQRQDQESQRLKKQSISLYGHGDNAVEVDDSWNSRKTNSRFTEEERRAAREVAERQRSKQQRKMEKKKTSEIERE